MSQETKNKYYEDAIDQLKIHAQKSNEEVGLIQVDFAVLKNDVGHIKEDLGEFKDYVKPKLDTMHDTQRYWMGGLALLMVIMPFVVAIILKFI